MSQRGIMYQVRQIIKLAASRLGVLNIGSNLDGTESQIVLDIFRMTLDEMSVRYLNYRQYDKTTPAKTMITIGSDTTLATSGDILEKPATIDKVILTIGNINYPQIIKPYSEYFTLPYQIVNAIPNTVYIRNDYPLDYLYFYPGITIPGTIRILGRSYLLKDDLTLDDYVDLQREYISAVVLQLALKSAGYFGAVPDQSLVIDAANALKHIKQKELIRNMPTLKNDMSGNYNFNFYAGI